MGAEQMRGVEMKNGVSASTFGRNLESGRIFQNEYQTALRRLGARTMIFQIPEWHGSTVIIANDDNINAVKQFLRTNSIEVEEVSSKIRSMSDIIGANDQRWLRVVSF